MSSENATWKEPDISEPETSIEQTIYRFLMDYLVIIVFVTLSISILACSSLFFYVLYKFKRLHTPTNYLILNFLVCINLFNFSCTALIALKSYWQQSSERKDIITLPVCFLNSSLLFLLSLSFDWFITAKCSTIMTHWHKKQKYLAGAIYSYLIINSILIKLRVEANLLAVMLFPLLYLTNLITIITFNIIKSRIKSSQISYALHISTAYALMWLPVMIVALFRVGSDNILLFSLFYLMLFVAVSSPIVMIVMLGKLDKHFKRSFHCIINRSSRNFVQSNGHVNEEDAGNGDAK